MNRIFKTAILSIAVAATTLATLPAAIAGDNWRRHHGGYRHHGGSSNDLAVAGILGLAAGALVVGLTARQEPVYREPAYAPRPQPDRDYAIRGDTIAYAGSLEPWSAEWYQYCVDRYQSFDPHSGTFVGYDGQTHFCVAN